MDDGQGSDVGARTRKDAGDSEGGRDERDGG